MSVAPEQQHPVVGIDDVAANHRRGGETRAVLTPTTTGATSGFMGVARLAEGECIAEHYHPYSEEFLLLIEGELTVDIDGSPVVLAAGQGMCIPKHVRHRLRNTGAARAFAVFHLAPLAPTPPEGHVDTEDAAAARKYAAERAT
ncbi:cupin domain-containing protein [Streptomyces xiaopingdaonensis]|uniref:cupin domain-containing protein n=1 Tax=Streptomyces xiaopingdaonensis TaxID=1565415 RepID=UPI00036604BD|nr:cupin domain-containing protein [Streptomyces xiaopingdaonensis]